MKLLFSYWFADAFFFLSVKETGPLCYESHLFFSLICLLPLDLLVLLFLNLPEVAEFQVLD